MLARNKLNSIEALLSHALINSEITDEDFTTIIEDYYRRQKVTED